MTDHDRTDPAETEASSGPKAGLTRLEVVERLRAAGVPSPEADARWLLEGFPSNPAALADAVIRRERREPLQLILGTAPFRWIEVEVAAGVFVPRPETEVLAGLAIDRLTDGAIVIEPCTGTGAISCAIAHETGASRIVATDINPRAVALARRNARPHPQVEVHHASLFAGVDPSLLGTVDVIVCNPPYLDPSQMAAVDPEVRDHDPYEALVGGESGWEVIADLVAAAPHWLRPGGWIVIEDDPSRVDQTAQALAHHVGSSSVEPDLTGRDRFAMARRA